MRWASVPQIDVERTRARTSLGPGSGTGFSWISRTLGSRTTRACIVSVICAVSPGGSRGGTGAEPLHRLSKLGSRGSARQGLSIIDRAVCSGGGVVVGDGGEVGAQQLGDRQLVLPRGVRRAVGV